MIRILFLVGFSFVAYMIFTAEELEFSIRYNGFHEKYCIVKCDLTLQDHLMREYNEKYR